MNLRSLSLQLLSLECLCEILPFTPNLKYLNLILLSDCGLNEQFYSNLDLSSIKLKTFSLILQKCQINQTVFRSLVSFIKQFSSSLTSLSLDFHQIKTDGLQFDGIILHQQFLKSMIQLKSFHLYMQLDEQSKNVQRFLASFQTQYWFDHQLIFGMHGTYLYTLPFHFDKLKDFTDFDGMKSSNSRIFNSFETWSYVKSIEFSDSFQFKSNVIEQLKLKMANLTSTTLTFQLMHNLYKNNNQSRVSLDSITTVYYAGKHYEAMKYCLIDIFPNTRYLILSLDPQPVEASSVQEYGDYFRHKWMKTNSVYSSKIEYLEMKMTLLDTDCLHEHVIHLVKDLLEIFLNLRLFVFHCHHCPRFPSILPFTDLIKTIELLNLETFFQEYHIKHVQNYLQFVRKNNQ